MGRKAACLTGLKFNNLTVLSRDSANALGKPHWHCACACGNAVIVSSVNLKKGQLGCGNNCALIGDRVDGWAISDKSAPDYIRKGYKSWADQNQRCTNPKDPRYQWWGAKGIRVEYSALEFVTWFAAEWKKKGPFKRANCSRKNHSRNYCLDNITLEECSANSIETWDRSKRKSRAVHARNTKTFEVREFPSACSAAKHTGVAKSAIQHQLKNGLQRTVRRGWVFTYPEA